MFFRGLLGNVYLILAGINNVCVAGACALERGVAQGVSEESEVGMNEVTLLPWVSQERW